MTAREAYEAKKARLQAEPNNYRTTDPALRALIDLAQDSINRGPAAGNFMTAFNMASDIIEPK